MALIRRIEMVEFDLQLAKDWPVKHYDLGFTAQQLEEVIPEAVTHREDPDEMLSVQQLPIVSHLIRAVQQVADRLDRLEARSARY